MDLDRNLVKKLLTPVVGVVIAGVGWLWLSAPTEKTLLKIPTVSATSKSVAAVVTIYISGKVQNPGVIELPLGSRVIDAVKAAGGMTISQPNLNLARILVDGEQIVVAKVEAIQSGTVGGKVNLNTADQSQLETISGIGPVMAQKILEMRNKKGRFQSISDLDEISGVGPSLLAELQKSAVVQ